MTSKEEQGGTMPRRQALLEQVTRLYQEQKEIDSHVSLSGIAEECGINSLMVRKLLITSGVYETSTSRRIVELWKEGKTVREIQEKVGLSLSSIHSYLPYFRSDYSFSGLSGQENRNRREAREKLARGVAMLNMHGHWDAVPEDIDRLLWSVLPWYQGCSFTTAKNLEFTYKIKGNEMFVSRKEKSITRATVMLAFHKAMDLQRGGRGIAGPKKLGTFGASYLFPVFLHLGVVTLEERE